MPGPETPPRPSSAAHSSSGAHSSSRAHASPGVHSSSGAHAAPSQVPDTASDVVRWAAFSCVLVPVVLVWYGTSLAGAAGTALGLAAVTGACRMLLRQSERGAAQLRTEGMAVRTEDMALRAEGTRVRTEERAPQHARHSRGGPGTVGGAHARSGAGVMGGAYGRSGAGAHRGGRHGGGNKPVD